VRIFEKQYRILTWHTCVRKPNPNKLTCDKRRRIRNRRFHNRCRNVSPRTAIINTSGTLYDISKAYAHDNVRQCRVNNNGGTFKLNVPPPAPPPDSVAFIIGNERFDGIISKSFYRLLYLRISLLFIIIIRL